ncbi:hypothetical protein HPB47_017005 [Ixodes persulcatus]|uniref:Uncharacterized protein n=1 Tax=Ixodes persulcatus TaxID=34615 RepID=A0AC60QPE4_IXOPE|nr:hypothetical protein HPB47_017005 [Ixodes persulcatus]
MPGNSLPDDTTQVIFIGLGESEEEKDDEELVREGGTQGSGQSKSNRRPSGTSTINLRRGSQAPRGETSAETRGNSNDLRRDAQTPRDPIALLPSARGAGLYEVDSAARKATGDYKRNPQAPDSVRLADHSATQVTGCLT